MDTLAWLVVGMLLGRIAYLLIAIYRLERKNKQR